MLKITCLAGTTALFAAVLPACTATSAQTPLADASNVALGERASVDGPIVQPIAILEDSRCPVDARCIWAGRLRLKMLWIRGNGEGQPFEVTLGEETPIADGSITLDAVRPEQHTDKKIKSSDYRFSFRFAGGF